MKCSEAATVAWELNMSWGRYLQVGSKLSSSCWHIMVIQRRQLLPSMIQTQLPPVLEIKPVLTVQPTLNSALLTYGLSMLPVTLNSSKDRCGLCIEAGCVPCCTQNSCITAAYNIYYRRRGNSQMLLRMGLVPVLYRKDARLLVVNFATTENRKFAISKWIYTT